MNFFLKFNRMLTPVFCMTDFDVSNLNGPSSGIFNDLKDSVVTVGNSSIYTAIAIVAVIAVISLGITVIKSIFGNAKNKASAKIEILVIIAVSILAFGVIGLVKILEDIGGGMF